MRRALLTAALALLLGLAAQPAMASISDSEELTRIGELGAGAGQLNSPRGLASDPVTGHLFAAENGNNRVSEFTPWGDFVKAFGFDVAPGAVNEQQEVRVRAAAGQFKLTFNAQSTPDLPFDASASEVEAALNALSSIGPGGSVSVKTVPGSPDGTTPHVHVIAFKGSLAAGNVGQLQAADGTTPLSGGSPSSSLEVRTRAEGTTAGTGLESCTEESGCKAGVVGGGPGQFNGPRGVAVDAAGNVYVKERANLRVQKFDPAGRFVLTFGGKVNKTTNANLCTKASGNLCGAGVAGAGPGEFGTGIIEGIAFCPPGPLCPAGALFVADVGRVQRFGPEGVYESELAIPGETVVGVAFDPVGEDVYVTFAGKVGTRELDGATGAVIGQPRKGDPAIATNAAGELFAASEFKVVLEYGPTGSPLSPPSCCEAERQPPPNESQFFTLTSLGTNGAGDLHVAYVADADSFIRVFGPAPVEFEGPPPVPPEITGQFASSVLRDGATVAAFINPHFFTDTTYRVQYGTGECSSGGCPDETAPPALLTTKAFGQPLRSAGVFLEGLTPGTTYHYRFLAESGGGGPVLGPEATFTTPDPLPRPACPNDVFRGGASARLPDCRAYEMVSPVDKNHGDIKTLVDLIGYDTRLGQASEDGEKLTYSSSRSFGDPEGAPLTNQYLARRVWTSEAISARQGPGADVDANPESVGNPYKGFSEDLCWGWFVVAAEPLLDPPRDFLNFPNVYRRDLCGGAPDEALLPVHPTVEPSDFSPELQGASADGGAAIVRVKDELTPDAASGLWQTYYASEGELRFLCVLPDGNPVAGNCSGGTGLEFETFLPPAELNRKSNVENAISDDGGRVYWTDSGGKESGAGSVYLRINPGEEQSALSGEECTEAGKACTVKVSGTVTPQPSRFLGATADGAKALFEVTAGGFAKDLFLFDAEAGASTPIAGDVVGVAATSEDLSRVYFVSTEALAPGAGAGQPNLYLDEGGAKTFIATLSQEDVAATDVPSNTARAPIYHVARASADGGELAFISTRSLTGYDNADLATGTPDSEVYLYEAGAAGPLCVSCNPSGARPRGRVVKGNGNVPGKLATAGALPAPEGILYVPRALSDNGERLFFESFDALLPRDVNGAKDVYEWESAASRAACEAMGAELYVASAGGCLSLISSGESPEDSEFLDAGAGGDDVFFVTLSGLLPQDPGLFDVYDARVGGGLPGPVSPPECQGETCKPPATAPSDPTPASSAYVGPGDLEEKAKKKKKADKKKHKKHKKKKKKKKGGRKGRAGR